MPSKKAKKRKPYSIPDRKNYQVVPHLLPYLQIIALCFLLLFWWFQFDMPIASIGQLCFILLSIGISGYQIADSFFRVSDKSKEIEHEKNWGLREAHGELIIENWRWTAISRSLIRACKEGELFTAFLLKWGERIFFVTSYHCYLTKEEDEGASDYKDLVSLNENSREVVSKDLSKRILSTQYWFLYDNDDIVDTESANGIRCPRKVFKNCTVCINAKQDILAIDVTHRKGDLHWLVRQAVCKSQFDGCKIFDGCAGWTLTDSSFFDKYLSSRTAVILHHPDGAVVSRSSGMILSRAHEKEQFKKGVISYKARTLGASSGSPVMVTYRFENENVPMIVGVHSGSPKEKKDTRNEGSFLLPFLDDFNQYILKRKEEMGNECFTFDL